MKHFVELEKVFTINYIITLLLLLWFNILKEDIFISIQIFWASISLVSRIMILRASTLLRILDFSGQPCKRESKVNK